MFETDEGDGVRFHEATQLTIAEIAAVQEVIRRRVLSLFERRGLIDAEAADNLRQWEHGGGFSLDATIRIEAHDRGGLERLLRYCARPALASERLAWSDDGQHVIYRLPRAGRDGQTVVVLSPLELLERLSVLIPPPRCHRHRYHGVLAPNAPLRVAATARAALPIDFTATLSD